MGDTETLFRPGFLTGTRFVSYHTVDLEGFVGSTFHRYVTKFAPHTALKLIA